MAFITFEKKGIGSGKLSLYEFPVVYVSKQNVTFSSKAQVVIEAEGVKRFCILKVDPVEKQVGFWFFADIHGNNSYRIMRGRDKVSRFMVSARAFLRDLRQSHNITLEDKTFKLFNPNRELGIAEMDKDFYVIYASSPLKDKHMEDK
jgi:hypothetical protein